MKNKRLWSRFVRNHEEITLKRNGSEIVERSTFGDARRELHDQRAALIAYYARIAELLDDRWIRATPFVDDLVVAEEPALVAEALAGDRDALAVYTDWLLDRGDPRGELAALRTAPTPDERKISSLEKTRGVELFGPLSTLGNRWRDQFAYVWRDGWVDEIVFRHAIQHVRTPPDKEVMQHALHAPMARFTRWLNVDTWYVIPICESLGDTCVAQIRGVRHDCVTICYGLMLEALPALEELELLRTSVVEAGHPRVRRLRVTVDEDQLDIRGEWPSLHTLEIVAKQRVDADQLAEVRERLAGVEITIRPG
ncbi:MAG: hypothetical protein M4D80_14250 [Myxococcota bacterium]|nr:hypothetical protein [Myxococcota bacterium]